MKPYKITGFQRISSCLIVGKDKVKVSCGNENDLMYEGDDCDSDRY